MTELDNDSARQEALAAHHVGAHGRAGQTGCPACDSGEYRCWTETTDAGLLLIDRRHDLYRLTVMRPAGAALQLEVWGPEQRFGRMEPAHINWSSTTSAGLDATDALRFATLIDRAAVLANELNSGEVL